MALLKELYEARMQRALEQYGSTTYSSPSLRAANLGADREVGQRVNVVVHDFDLVRVAAALVEDRRGAALVRTRHIARGSPGMAAAPQFVREVGRCSRRAPT